MPGHLQQRFALLDPATGKKDWLPGLKIGQNQMLPVELGASRIILVDINSQVLTVHVFDRDTREWSEMSWPGLPSSPDFPRATMGPDNRLYVSLPATHGSPPPGGWPIGPDGEAEDADADGDTYDLWSVSLTDSSDVRDEGLKVGSVAFTDSSMVWTDSTNGAAGMVHVRDLATGDEHSFDPHAGDRCNLLSFGATDSRVVMGEYCGTYAGGVRDDRLQILDTDGHQGVTIQDSGMDGALAGPGTSSDLATLTAYDGKHAGTYVYDLGTGRFLRISDSLSKFGLGGEAPGSMFLWQTPVNHGHGAQQWLGELGS